MKTRGEYDHLIREMERLAMRERYVKDESDLHFAVRFLVVTCAIAAILYWARF